MTCRKEFEKYLELKVLPNWFIDSDNKGINDPYLAFYYAWKKKEENDNWISTSIKDNLPIDGQLCLFYSNRPFAGIKEERFEKMRYKKSWEDDVCAYWSHWKPITAPTKIP